MYWYLDLQQTNLTAVLRTGGTTRRHGTEQDRTHGHCTIRSKISATVSVQDESHSHPQCCRSKCIEFGSRSRSLAQFEFGSRVNFGKNVKKIFLEKLSLGNYKKIKAPKEIFWISIFVFNLNLLLIYPFFTCEDPDPQSCWIRIQCGSGSSRGGEADLSVVSVSSWSLGGELSWARVGPAFCSVNRFCVSAGLRTQI